MPSCFYLYAGVGVFEESGNDRNSEGNIHLVWSHRSSFLTQAKPTQLETVTDNAVAFLKNYLLQYSTVLLFNKFCQVPATMHCIYCKEMSLLPLMLKRFTIFMCMCVHMQYAWVNMFACTVCVVCSWCVPALVFYYRSYFTTLWGHYWYLKVKMRSFQRLCPEVKPDGILRILTKRDLNERP